MALEQSAGVRDWYNRIAARFVQRYKGWNGWYYRHFEEDVVLHGSDFTNLRVLDLGTGGGRFVGSIHPMAREVVGVDISDAMIDIAKSAVKAPNVQFRVMDASKMDFEKGSFDAVVSLGMFEYMDRVEPILKQVHSILRAKGQFIFVFHQRSAQGETLKENPEDDYYGAKVKDRNALWTKAYQDRTYLERALEQEGFRILRIQRIMFRFPIRLLQVIKRFFPEPTGFATRLAAIPLLAEMLMRHIPWLSKTSGVAVAFTEKR